MSRGNGGVDKFHPHCVLIPDSISIILYYITRVLRKPVFAGTELGIFRTPAWWRWIKDNNLPPSVMRLMNGTLTETYGLKVEEGQDVMTTSVNLDDDLARVCTLWLEGWRKQCGHRTYTHHEATEARPLLPN